MLSRRWTVAAGVLLAGLWGFSPVLARSDARAPGAIISAGEDLETRCEDTPVRAPRVERSRTHTFDIRDYGAIGDGTTLNTAAFQAAVAAVAEAGEGLLVVPCGRWLTGPFNLTSHLTLYLAEDAVLLGSEDVSSYPVIPALPSYGQGRDHPGPRYSSLINGYDLVDIELTGNNGTIDAQGKVWWDRHYKGTERYTRGHVVELMYSTDILMSYLTLRNSPFWTVHPFSCRRVHAHHLTIINPQPSPNTDGLDPDSSSDVLIEDSYFHVGDDGVAIKSGWDCFGRDYGEPAQNIRIRNLTVSSPTAAGVCLGSEMSGGIRNVSVEGCHFMDVHAGVRIKSSMHRGGFVANVSFTDIRLERNQVAMQFNDFYGAANPSCPWPSPQPVALPVVSDITVQRLRGTGIGQAGDIEGLLRSPITGLHLSDVRLSATHGFNCSHVVGSSADVVPRPCAQLRPPRAAREAGAGHAPE